MKPRARLLPAWALAAACLLAGGARADIFDPVTYELAPGSSIVDDCFCDRLPIERPLAGAFVLTRLPVKIRGELYSLTDIDFTSVPADPGDPLAYAVRGSGAIHRDGLDLLEQSMHLEVEVNGAGGIVLESGVVQAGSAWPSIDVTARESMDPARDPFHIYSIRIVASPRPEPVPYELVEGDPATLEGSFFLDECRLCGRLDVPLPVAGSFVVRPTGGGGPNPFTFYAVEALDVHTTRPGLEYKISGGGTYEWGGEVALLQAMDLTVSVNAENGVILSSGKVPFAAGVSFPDIDIRLEHQNPVSDVHVYSLHLVARPSRPLPAAEFRRGDANADGSGDISDAVYLLLWRFAGGSQPGCLDAADSNGDGKHDISDAVYFLLYLFQGGPAPPAPGADACGAAPQPVFGCENHPPCLGM